MITVANVANASQVQLLCITYELFLYHVEEAIKSEGKERAEEVDKAREVLMSLTEDLDFEVALAGDLFKLYVYVQNILINYKDDNEKLKEASKLVNTIYQGYLQLAQEEGESKPIMQNAESIYAGITYGKGYLNEMVMQDSDRGFKA